MYVDLFYQHMRRSERKKMDREDIIREIDKVGEAIDWAIKREEGNSESNAAQHCSSKILYSPLCTKLHSAKDALNKLTGELLDRTEEDNLVK